jgi:hypothetical protein
VFGSTTTEDYFLRVRRAAAFGVVAVTASGRRNFIHSAPRVGLQYRPNGLILTADWVRAVLTSGEDRVHAFPDVMPARMNVCASCGKPLR